MQIQPDLSKTLAMTPGLRLFLYITAAVTGAAVLIVEILGAKMLAPYMGTSHFVWTAQIAVTLISLAAGYYFGGWLADRAPRLERLYVCILLAAIYLCLAVLMCEPVAYRCLQYKLALGALMVSGLLFFVPLTLLAVTAPFLIRVMTSSVSTLGRQAGRLSSLSTLGSVAGTVLIGYVLIPFLPNSMTMILTAGLLIALVTVYFLVWGAKSPQKSIALFVVVLGVVLGFGVVKTVVLTPKDDNGRELFRANSNFGQMQVWQNMDGTRRYYLNDFLTQNTYDPTQKKSVSLFTYMLHGLAHAYCPQVRDVLCIGMGVGIVPMQFAHEGAKVDVVEINPAVVPLATRFFDLEPDKLNIHIGDGRYYLNGCAKQYNAIILDAFLGDSSPSHLLSREAFLAMRRVLSPGGVLVINSFVDFDPGKDFFGASLDMTLRSVFQSVRIHEIGNGNVFFVASDQRELRITTPPDLSQAHESCAYQVKECYERVRLIHPGAGQVLRDDYNPVDFYDAGNREHLRRQLAMSMR